MHALDFGVRLLVVAAARMLVPSFDYRGVWEADKKNLPLLHRLMYELDTIRDEGGVNSDLKLALFNLAKSYVDLCEGWNFAPLRFKEATGEVSTILLKNTDNDQLTKLMVECQPPSTEVGGLRE